MITINLPAETFKTCVDIESPKLTCTAEELFTKINSQENNVVRSMWAFPQTIGSYIEWNFKDLYINKITKGICKNTEDKNSALFKRIALKYFKLYLGFHDRKDIEFLVPGFIRFFSKTTKSFVPIEYLKKTDLLVDYTGNDVKMIRKEEQIDYNIDGQEYYSLLVQPEVITSPNNNITYDGQIYLNGVLTATSYYNFENCF